MRAYLTIIFLLVVCPFARAQDSIRVSDQNKLLKNEIGLNITPLIFLASGSNRHEFIKLSGSYRYNINRKNRIRISAGIFPYRYADLNLALYSDGFLLRTDTFLVYNSPQVKRSLKTQISFGYEYIFSSKKIIQSVGVDLITSYQHTDDKNLYYWLGQSTRGFTILQLRANQIDTMGTINSNDEIKFGLNLFYNVRIPVSKHWLISSTIGPYVGVIRQKAHGYDLKTKESRTVNFIDFDFSPLYLADISICFRF
jgi:hypothetical protein